MGCINFSSKAVLSFRCSSQHQGEKELDFEHIIPNASMRLAGSAFMTSANRKITSKIGSVMETDQEDLILWLHAYPLIGHDVDLMLDREHGAGKSDVSVITDHKTLKPEFSVGEAEFSGRKATVRLFSLPAFHATLKLSSPAMSLRHCRSGSLTLREKGHHALGSAR